MATIISFFKGGGRSSFATNRRTGEVLPCVMLNHITMENGLLIYRNDYLGLNATIDDCKKLRDYLLTTDRVLVCVGNYNPDGSCIKLTGYHSVWRIEDVKVDDTGMTFKLVQRLENAIQSSVWPGGAHPPLPVHLLKHANKENEK